MNTIIFGSNPEPYVGMGEHGITIVDPYVSPAHCQITQMRDGRFMVQDLGSMNGTYIIEPFGTRNPLAAHRGNLPRKVTEGTIMTKGSRVRIGRTTLPWVVDK